MLKATIAMYFVQLATTSARLLTFSKEISKELVFI